MKTFITYKDWLIKVRGKIEPKVGDNVVIFIDNLQKPIVLHHQDKTYCWKSKNNEVINIEDCYVEIELPEIEWETLDSHVTIGRINEFDLVKILSYKDKSELYKIQYSTPTCNLPLFEGTLSECKIKANELLWNKI